MMTAKPTDLVTQSCKSIQAYQEILPHIKAMVKTREIRVIKDVISQTKKLIKDRKCTPQHKVLLLDLFHECMMQKVPEFLNFAQEKILERLSILASKKSIDVFRDSNKSQENLKSSEDFLKNLLTYIQIWSLNFGKGAGGQQTFYGIIYSQLRAKVAFPPVQSRASFSSDPSRGSGGPGVGMKGPGAPMSQGAPGGHAAQVGPPSVLGQNVPGATGAAGFSSRPEGQRPQARPEKTDKETLDYLDNLLVIIEEIENPNENETGKELLANVASLKGNLDEILNRVLNKGDEIGIERTLNISERINKVLEGKKQRTSFYSSMPIKQEPRQQIKVDHDIRKPASVEFKEPAFQSQMKDVDLNEEKKIERPRTQVISKPVVNAPPPPAEPAKQSFNIFDDILSLDIEPISSPPPKSVFNTQPIFPMMSSPFASLNGSAPIEVSSNDRKFETEIEKLNLTIKEKDEKIALLESQLASIKQNFNELQDSLAKTRNILSLKEKECQELQALKSSQKESQAYQTIESLLSPRASIKPVKEPAADNQDFFKYILCEEMAVLYDSVLFQVGFQMKFENSGLKLICYISNRAKSPIQDVQLEVKSESFKISLDNSSFGSIPVASQIFFSISAFIKDFSPVFPRLIVSCTQDNCFYSVNLKLPINFCQFSSMFSSSPQKLWQEWDDLLFASENSTFRFKDAKDYIPKLLKLGTNVVILDSDVLPGLASREYLGVACINELVFFMTKVRRKEGEVDIEVRCNNAGLRQNMMKLLVSSLAD